MELTGGTQRAGGGVASVRAFGVAGGWTRGASSREARGGIDRRAGRSGEGLSLAGPRRGAGSGREQAAAWAVRSLSEIGLSEVGLRSGPKGKGGESGPQG